MNRGAESSPHEHDSEANQDDQEGSEARAQRDEEAERKDASTEADSSDTTLTVTGPPTISNLSPATGAAGVQVTISGSGFGPAQGTGAVWLGTTLGTVVSWGDTQIVATVASNAVSGNARVRQGGFWSDAVSFNVSTATISNVTPANGVPGTQVTITGSGFGAAQGSGQVWLGTANGSVQSWSDTRVVALVR